MRPGLGDMHPFEPGTHAQIPPGVPGATLSTPSSQSSPSDAWIIVSPQNPAEEEREEERREEEREEAEELMDEREELRDELEEEMREEECVELRELPQPSARVPTSCGKSARLYIRTSSIAPPKKAVTTSCRLPISKSLTTVLMGTANMPVLMRSPSR